MNEAQSVGMKFMMFGAREIIERTDGSVPIAEQVGAIEANLFISPGVVFDLCRSIVESTCKTILTERGIKCDSLGYNDLLKRTYTETSLLPDRIKEDEETANKLRELIVGLDAILFAVTHLRKTFGVASHGKTSSAQSLELSHALLAARSADALVHFLFMAHRYFFAPIEQEALKHDDHPEFNDYLNTTHDSISILTFEFSPSEVLFGTHREGYRIALSEFEP